jgi:ABC-type bacteriocin/lantibiotic exporter with double-glycine peptidase domain
MSTGTTRTRQEVSVRSTFLLHRRIVVPHLRKYWKSLLAVGAIMGSLMLLQLPAPLLMRYIIDDVLPSKRFSFLLMAVVALAGIAVTSVIFGVVNRYLVTVARERIMRDIEIETVDHVLGLPMSFFDKFTSGRLMARIGTDVSGVSGLLGETVASFIIDIMTFAFGVVIVWMLNWKLALVSLSLLPLFAISLFSFNKRLRSVADTLQDRIGRSMSTLSESFDGIRLIKSYVLERFQVEKLKGQLDDSASASIKYSNLASLSGASAGLVGSFAPLVVYLYGGHEIMIGNMTLGTLIAFNAYLGYVFGPTQRLFTMQGQVQAAVAALHRLDELRQMHPEQVLSDVSPLPMRRPVTVEFRDVSFGYNDGFPVLRNINMTIAPGEKIAIVGRSGIGKTTLAHLLLGFYPPSSGMILVGGVDIRTISLDRLRETITLVSQDTYLFAGSIRESIICGKRGASLEEVIAAAKSANAHDFIESLQESYETEVGPRGIKVSGGQRQRIAIARALIRDPEILILDEAESEIDGESEMLIQEALDKSLSGRTVIKISHRLSSVRETDRIIVLDGGTMVAEGSHSELYQNSPVYRRLCHSQIAAEGRN